MLTILFLVLRSQVFECNRRKEPVGFLDPALINYANICSNGYDDYFNYAVKALTHYQDKELILLPYNQA